MAGTVAFTIFFISFYLLFNPQILCGVSGWDGRHINVEAIPAALNVEVREEGRTKLSYEQGVRLQKVLTEHFEENQPFLKPRHTIRDLANETGIPTYLWSVFINQAYSKSFNEFINDYRLDHLEKLLDKGSTQRQYTLEALGKMIGFKSGAIFIAAVKRKTGKTPSELFGKKADIG